MLHYYSFFVLFVIIYIVLLKADFSDFRSSEAANCTDQGEIWQGGGDHRNVTTICPKIKL